MTLGQVEHASKAIEELGGGLYMRVRVAIDITKPLCCGRKIKLDSTPARWVSFKYERLPNFCYWCGCVTHGERDCAYWLANKITLKQIDQQFGPWMRATMDNGFRWTTVDVEGQIPDSIQMVWNTSTRIEVDEPGEPTITTEPPPRPMDMTKAIIDHHVTQDSPQEINLNQRNSAHHRAAQEALFAEELAQIDETLGLAPKEKSNPTSPSRKLQI